MLLEDLEDYVEVGVMGSDVERYEKLGYEIPKTINKHGNPTIPRNAKMKVKVKDLPDGSGVKIHCKCDYPGCENITYCTYSNYFKHNHNGLTYCRNHSGIMFRSGENNYKWNPNKTKEDRENGRKTLKYIDLVKRVLARDNFTCQVCGETSKTVDLVAHHLDGYNWCVEKRFDETNSICLCENCHENFHSIYGKGYNTKEQFMEWTNNFNLNLQKYNGEIPTCRWAYCIEDDEIIKDIYSYNPYIYTVCNKECRHFKCKHYLYYDEYIKMSKDEILDYISHRLDSDSCRPKVCLNTNQLFTTIKDITSWCGVKSGIRLCCNGRQRHAGYHPITGEKLRWQYLKDYIIENDCNLDDYLELWNNRYVSEN